MPVNLKRIPPLSWRPQPPRPVRWFGTLLCLLVMGAFISRLLEKVTGNDHFWVMTTAIPAVAWTIIALIRMMVYLLQNIYASAWDMHREECILQEVRRGRRALQVLAAEFITARPDNALSPLDALSTHHSQLCAQNSWTGEEGCYHTRLPVSEGTMQALDWVPLPENKLHHLWLAGLTNEQHGHVTALTGKSPLAALNPASDIDNLDRTLGNAGCAASWLAVAAAAQAAQLRDEAHMIISSEQGQNDIWSAVVAPCVTQQENVT